MRLPALVIAGAACVWLAGLAFGGALGLPPRFAILLDLACMAAFAWALVVVYRIWRRSNGGQA